MISKPLEYIIKKMDKSHIVRVLEKREGGIWSSFISTYACLLERVHEDDNDYTRKWLECIERKLELVYPYRYTFEMCLKNKDMIENYKDIVSKLKTNFGIKPKV